MPRQEGNQPERRGVQARKARRRVRRVDASCSRWRQLLGVASFTGRGLQSHLNSASLFFISRILLCCEEMVRSWVNTSRVSAFCRGQGGRRWGGRRG